MQCRKKDKNDKQITVGISRMISLVIRSSSVKLATVSLSNLAFQLTRKVRASVPRKSLQFTKFKRIIAARHFIQKSKAKST